MCIIKSCHKVTDGINNNFAVCNKISFINMFIHFQTLNTTSQFETFITAIFENSFANCG